jgi:hypothetical protein
MPESFLQSNLAEPKGRRAASLPSSHLPIAEPVSRQRYSLFVRPFPFTLPNVHLLISSPQSCISNSDKHTVNNPNEITCQCPSLGLSLSSESSPTQMTWFLYGQLPFQHPARMPSGLDDEVERGGRLENVSREGSGFKTSAYIAPACF